MLAGGIVIAYASVRWLRAGSVHISEWFFGSVIGHDLLLVPAYATADRLCVHLLGRRRWLIPYLRVPAALSLLLLAIWWPLILRHDPGRRPQTGLSTSPFLARWVGITAVLFLVSGAVAVAAMVRRSRHRAEPAAAT
jgi:hypothetical protein